MTALLLEMFSVRQTTDKQSGTFLLGEQQIIISLVKSAIWFTDGAKSRVCRTDIGTCPKLE